MNGEAAPASVTLCCCGHAERMHERDTAAEHDRGECRQGSCGCSEFRPVGEWMARPAAPAPLAPVVSLPVEKPETVAARPSFDCPECPRSFGTEQGLKVHKGISHKRDPDYAAIAAQIDAEATPDKQPGPEPAASAQAPASEPEPTPAPARPAAPARAVHDSRTIRIEFEAGEVAMSYTIDWTRLPFAAQSGLMDLTSILFRLGHVDHFAAVIGDEESDDFKGDPA